MRTESLCNAIWSAVDPSRSKRPINADQLLCAGLLTLSRLRPVPDDVDLGSGALFRDPRNSSLFDPGEYSSPFQGIDNPSRTTRADGFTVVDDDTGSRREVHEICEQVVAHQLISADLVGQIAEAIEQAKSSEPSLTYEDVVRAILEAADRLQTTIRDAERLLAAVHDLFVELATAKRTPKSIYFPWAMDPSLLWNPAFAKSMVWFQSPVAAVVAKTRLVLAALGLQHAWSESDPLTRPPTENGRLETFDLTVITPPFGLRKKSNPWPRPLRIDPRIDYPADESTPTELLHLIHGLESTCPDRGMAMAIISAGSLFRTGSAERLRSSLLRRAPVQLRTVISLPRVLAGVGIPASLLVFGHRDSKAPIRFIDATTDGLAKGRGSQYELVAKRLRALLSGREDVPGLMAIRSIEDVLEGECSWDVRRYIDTVVPDLPDAAEVRDRAELAADRARHARSVLIEALSDAARQRNRHA